MFVTQALLPYNMQFALRWKSLSKCYTDKCLIIIHWLGVEKCGNRTSSTTIIVRWTLHRSIFSCNRTAIRRSFSKSLVQTKWNIKGHWDRYFWLHIRYCSRIRYSRQGYSVIFSRNGRYFWTNSPDTPDLAVIVTNQKIDISTNDVSINESLSITNNVTITSSYSNFSSHNESDVDFNLLRNEILTLYSILTSISLLNVLGLAFTCLFEIFWCKWVPQYNSCSMSHTVFLIIAKEPSWKVLSSCILKILSHRMQQNVFEIIHYNN